MLRSYTGTWYLFMMWGVLLHREPPKHLNIEPMNFKLLLIKSALGGAHPNLSEAFTAEEVSLSISTLSLTTLTGQLHPSDWICFSQRTKLVGGLAQFHARRLRLEHLDADHARSNSIGKQLFVKLLEVFSPFYGTLGVCCQTLLIEITF